jgi:hypothetical protein
MANHVHFGEFGERKVRAKQIFGRQSHFGHV